MHGLINKGLQGFLTETYGHATWVTIADRAEVSQEGFEALMIYEPSQTSAVLDAAAGTLGKSREILLEDLGTYLVSHPTTEPVRRLLRFGGLDFAEFMNSLDELPGRAKLAVPNLDLPEIETREVATDAFEVVCRSPFAGFGRILSGLLRAMADDYGALVLIEWGGEAVDYERLTVRLLEGEFAEGRQFELSRRKAG
jgi:hypothetical protein